MPTLNIIHTKRSQLLIIIFSGNTVTHVTVSATNRNVVGKIKVTEGHVTCTIWIALACKSRLEFQLLLTATRRTHVVEKISNITDLCGNDKILAWNCPGRDNNGQKTRAETEKIV